VNQDDVFQACMLMIQASHLILSKKVKGEITGTGDFQVWFDAAKFPEHDSLHHKVMFGVIAGVTKPETVVFRMIDGPKTCFTFRLRDNEPMVEISLVGDVH
jgi:hypothetical protein